MGDHRHLGVGSCLLEGDPVGTSVGHLVVVDIRTGDRGYIHVAGRVNRKVVVVVEENGYIHTGWREADPVDDRTGRDSHHRKKAVVDGASEDIAVGGKIAGAGDSLPGTLIWRII